MTAPAPPAYGNVAPDHPRSTLALILGILGIVACSIVAPFALVIGRGAVKEIDASGGRLGGRSMAQAGFILGVIGTAILALTLIGGVVLIIVAAERLAGRPASPPRRAVVPRRRVRPYSTNRSPVGAIDGSVRGRSTTNSVRCPGKTWTLISTGWPS